MSDSNREVGQNSTNRESQEDKHAHYRESLAGTDFDFGQEVIVERSSGEKESGWKVLQGPGDSEGRRIMVVKVNSMNELNNATPIKQVRIEKLKEWQES